MGKFTADAAKMLELVGGKENISAVTHCMTRMRFVLADPAKADIKARLKEAGIAHSTLEMETPASHCATPGKSPNTCSGKAAGEKEKFRARK